MNHVPSSFRHCEPRRTLVMAQHTGSMPVPSKPLRPNRNATYMRYIPLRVRQSIKFHGILLNWSTSQITYISIFCVKYLRVQTFFRLCWAYIRHTALAQATPQLRIEANVLNCRQSLSKFVGCRGVNILADTLRFMKENKQT